MKMDVADESLIDIFHGYDIDKMKKDIEKLNKAIDKCEDLVNNKETSEHRKEQLNSFINRCKLMRYRIENRIDIIEKELNDEWSNRYWVHRSI